MIDNPSPTVLEHLNTFYKGFAYLAKPMCSETHLGGRQVKLSDQVVVHQ